MEARGSELERGSLVVGYRIDQLIGRGGMGVVYRATNVALNRIYALKVLAPELADDEQFRQRFKREMRIAGSLHHPSVVGIHYAGEHDGLLFLVMDFISGTDLQQVMAQSGPIEPHRASDLLTQVASALDAAHERGLVHRDVKPANVLIAVPDGEERAYLTDFGLAKRFDSGSSIAGLTQTGVVVGTVDYMSPEQITGGHTDARSDIYALGCIFFQMLTGQVPYERQNSVATLFAHLHEPPPALEGALDELYPTFGAVIERAMAKNPDDRHLSAGDFARDAVAALCGSRYTGPETVVATGEARPPPSGQDAIEPPNLSSAATRPAQDVTAAQARPEPPPSAERAAPTAERAAPTVPAGGVPDHPGSQQPPSAPPPTSGAAGTSGLAEPPKKRSRLPIFAGLALIVAAAIVVIVILAGGGSSTPPGEPFAAAAKPVPTNRVTGDGSATVHLNGDVASVTVDTNGLLNDQPHAMHIHAGGKGICPPASAARLHRGNLAISTTDGIAYYGPPRVSLTTKGDTSVRSKVDFSRYPRMGDIRYTRPITVPPGVAAAIRAGNAVIVVHGIDYDHNGIYDNIIDRSELKSSLPGEATAPALCGTLVPTKSASISGVMTYNVILRRTIVAAVAPASSFTLLCHLLGVDTTALSDRRVAGATAT
jgi:serine/threonine protein kinase